MSKTNTSQNFAEQVRISRKPWLWKLTILAYPLRNRRDHGECSSRKLEAEKVTLMALEQPFLDLLCIIIVSLDLEVYLHTRSF